MTIFEENAQKNEIRSKMKKCPKKSITVELKIKMVQKFLKIKNQINNFFYLKKKKKKKQKYLQKKKTKQILS